MIDAKLISELREKTGAGINDVKTALDEAAGDIVKAEDILRKKGVVKATKKAERAAGEGVVHAYVHGNEKVGVLLEVHCETDFVARNETFKALVHDIAIHIAASAPSYVKPEDVPAEILDNERAIAIEQLKDKPKEMVDKILEGKMQKYYSEVCLLKQPFIKDESKTIEEVIKEAVAKLGENIQVGRFTRYAAQSAPVC